MSGAWEDRRLGTVSEAREALGLPDNAAVWDLVADGTLRADRHLGGPWEIWRERT